MPPGPEGLRCMGLISKYLLKYLLTLTLQECCLKYQNGATLNIQSHVSKNRGKYVGSTYINKPTLSMQSRWVALTMKGLQENQRSRVITTLIGRDFHHAAFPSYIINRPCSFPFSTELHIMKWNVLCFHCIRERQSIWMWFVWKIKKVWYFLYD